MRCAALHALGNSAFDASNRRRYLQSPGLMQLLVMLAAAPDTPAPRHTSPSPTQRRQAASSSATRAAAASTGLSVQKRQKAEAEGTVEGAAVIIAAAASGAGKPPPASAAAGEPTAAAGKAGTASTAPVAPNPHDSLSSAADAEPDRLPSSPPNAVTMSRGASTTASSAAAGGSSSSDAAAGSYGVNNSEQSALPPQKAAAAAAGAAAAEAAAVTALPAAAAAAGKKGAAGSAVAAPPTVAAAADAILLHKKKLVAVNNPVKLQAIRLLGILGELPACLLVAPGHAWVPPCWQLAHTASSGQPVHIPPSSIFLAHFPAQGPHLCRHCTHWLFHNGATRSERAGAHRAGPASHPRARPARAGNGRRRHEGKWWVRGCAGQHPGRLCVAAWSAPQATGSVVDL